MKIKQHFLAFWWPIDNCIERVHNSRSSLYFCFILITCNVILFYVKFVQAKHKCVKITKCTSIRTNCWSLLTHRTGQVFIFTWTKITSSCCCDISSPWLIAFLAFSLTCCETKFESFNSRTAKCSYYFNKFRNLLQSQLSQPFIFEDIVFS